MNRTHPLEIPEILSRVARHVPLWVYTRPSYDKSSAEQPMGLPYFDPRHLLSCILVNRTWHDNFLPILCFSFDDTAIHTAPITHTLTTTTTLHNCPMDDIPGTGITEAGPTTTVKRTTSTKHPPAVSLFLRNSQRFRLMVLTRPCAPILALPPSLLPVHLLHLELVGLDDDTIPFFRSSLSYSSSAPYPSSSSSPSSTLSSTATPSSLQPSPSSSSSAWSKSLILQNTRLQSLRWQGGDFQRDNHGMLDSLALAAKLHRLQDLVLECWRLDQGFVELLRRNPQLRTLALDFVTGEALPPFPRTTMVQEDDAGMSELSTSSSPYLLSLLKIPSASSGAYTPAKSTAPSRTTATATTITGRYPPEWDDNEHGHRFSHPKCNPNPYGFQLVHLTCLSVCKDVESGAFETLIRLCPNLEELSWMGPLDSDLEALTLNLSQCCTRVAVLTYSTVEVSEPEERYADLVRSLPTLVDLQIRIPTLEGGHFARALLEKHAGSLEILDLRIVNRRNAAAAAAAAGDTNLTDMDARDQKTGEHLRRILMGCSELTALSIEGVERMAEYLFLFTWACSHRLHRLFLGASITYTDNIDTADDDDDDDDEEEGEAEGEDVGAANQQAQQQQQESQEHYPANGTTQGVGAQTDEFLAEAALFGWSVVGSSGTSTRRRRHANGTSANGDDGHEGEGDDDEVAIVHGSGSSSNSNAVSAPVSPSGCLDDSSSSSISEANHTYESSTASTHDEDTTMSTAPSITAHLVAATTESHNSSSSSSLSSPATASSSSSEPTAPSFVRDMMHRLEDMPRLQSFVLNNVEYTRMHSLTAR